NTCAHTATHNWLAVRTEPDAPKHKGVSLLIVPMDRPGITVQGLDTWSGIRTNAVFFEDVRVPRDHLIRQRGNGFYYVMMALDFERIPLRSTAGSSASTPPPRCSASAAAPTKSSAASPPSAASGRRESSHGPRDDARAAGGAGRGPPLSRRRGHARAPASVGRHGRRAR